MLYLTDIYPERVVVTEGYKPNFELAKKLLIPLGVKAIYVMDDLEELLPFEDSSFDLIIDRHSAYNNSEVERVLKSSGTFITQQVGGRNEKDLMLSFDVQPKWEFFTLEFTRQSIEGDTDLIIEKAEEWQGKIRYLMLQVRKK